MTGKVVKLRPGGEGGNRTGRGRESHNPRAENAQVEGGNRTPGSSPIRVSCTESPLESPFFLDTTYPSRGYTGSPAEPSVDGMDDLLWGDAEFRETVSRGNRAQKARAESWRRAGDRFLKSPPLDALIAAGKLPGKALLAYVAIRHRLDLTEKHRKFETTLPAKVTSAFGLTRRAKDQAVIDLAAAGLITVERKHGHPARISLSGAWRSHNPNPTEEC